MKDRRKPRGHAVHNRTDEHRCHRDAQKAGEKRKGQVTTFGVTAPSALHPFRTPLLAFVKPGSAKEIVLSESPYTTCGAAKETRV